MKIKLNKYKLLQRKPQLPLKGGELRCKVALKMQKLRNHRKQKLQTIEQTGGMLREADEKYQRGGASKQSFWT